MNTKRAAQAGHQSVMKTFDKEGAKSFKQAESTFFPHMCGTSELLECGQVRGTL